MKIMYHITESSKVPSIRKHGLLLKHKKNVPLSKPVNYVFGDLMHAGFFASEMSWQRETDISIIWVKVDPSKLRKDWNTGATVGVWFEYHSDIKPSQIIKVEKWDDKAKKRHQKLMNERFR